MGTKFVDLTGKKFDRLKVIQRCGSDCHKKAVWLCLCDCGNELKVTSGSLNKKNTTSCGCYRAENILVMNRTHGRSYKTEYRSWAGMIQRCTNINNDRYYDYGGRGIVVCERWRTFENFFEDMGPKPSNEHSIDRIDVNGNYEFENCKWSTDSEQSINQRKNKRNISGVPGVIFVIERNTWMSRINVDSKRINLGSFKNFDDAVNARKNAELKYWGKRSS